MYRKDREVTEFSNTVDILRRCDTIRIGLQGDDYPYVVPVSFGLKQEGENICLYFHGAKRGLKVELIDQFPKVCVESDIFHKVEETAHGITTRYESVIGYGVVEKVVGDEIIEGLRSICEHYGHSDYRIGRCKGLPMTTVYKIKLEYITGKQNLSDN